MKIIRESIKISEKNSDCESYALSGACCYSGGGGKCCQSGSCCYNC